MSTAPLRKQSAPVLVSQPPVPSYSSSGSRPRDSIDRSVNASSPSSKPASTQTAGASSSARANAIAREQRRIAKKSAENLRISVGTSASYSNNLSGSYQASQAPPASSTKTFKRSIGASSSNRKLTSAREAGSTSLVTSNTSLQNNASNSTSLNHLPSTTRSETLESSSNVNGKSAVSSAANPDASHTMPRLDSDPLAVPPSNAQRQRKPSRHKFAVYVRNPIYHQILVKAV
ncbi:hypothetical protein BC830DRAFT_1175471 [Chytriomyces sp. MP71]|nr:hypothetical protein BC830DRAFT_1175471 [Chytriomyces sp. MP71]